MSVPSPLRQSPWIHYYFTCCRCLAWVMQWSQTYDPLLPAMIPRAAKTYFETGFNQRPAGVSSRTRFAGGGGDILPLLLLSHEPRVAEGPARRRSKYLTEKIPMSA